MSTIGNLRKHRPRKRFGQHFLCDASVIAKIIAMANPQTHDCFIEIGPGLGALTVPLLKQLNHLHVVELDCDIIPKLATLTRAKSKLIIHQGDALEFDYASIGNGQRLRIIGNLPYNISTPLLFRLLSFRQCIGDMHLMLQREVVLRLGAQANSKNYGRLSVICQYYCQVEPLLDVSPDSFAPPPKVNSSLVRLKPYRKAPIDVGNIKTFETLLRYAFAQRRKTLRNNLKPVLSAKQIEACGVQPGARAESLQLEQFAALSRLLHSVPDPCTTFDNNV